MREVTTHRSLLQNIKGEITGHPDTSNDNVRVEAQDEKGKGGAPYTYTLWVPCWRNYLVARLSPMK